MKFAAKFGARCVVTLMVGGVVIGVPLSDALDPVSAASTRSAGAKPLGTTTYPVPVGAIFVSSAGNDSASGSQTAPLKTIGRAITAAPHGGTVVIRGGVYRESLTISNERLTLQPYPNEAVIIRGSRTLSSFIAVGGDWRRDGWNYQFPRQAPETVAANYPMANAPDMVFYDGQPLRQVSKLSQVSGKAFFVDYTTSQLFIGIDPVGHVLEGSYLQTALMLNNADNSIVRGLQFERFATPVNTHGAVVDLSDDVTFEHNIFVDNASSGLSLRGNRTVVAGNTFGFNGQLGLHAFQTDGAVIEDNKINNNNTERFDQFQEAGGAKLVQSVNVQFAGNYVLNNIGNGIWFDIDSDHAVIVRNEAFSNNRNGIQFEISDGAIIAGNTVRSNTDVGIHIIESTNIDVYNNVVYKNDVALTVWDGSRPHLVGNIAIRNNVLMDARATSTALLDVDDKTHTLSGAEMGVTADYNAYCRSVAGTPSRVVDWSRSNTTQANYNSVSAFRAGTGNETHGLACEATVATGFFVKASTGNFALSTSSVGRGAGGALPANVAAALGVTAGVAVDVGLL